MSTEANKALVRRFWDELNQGNLAAIDELVAEDYVAHVPGLTVSGRENLRQILQAELAAFPDMQVTIEDIITEGNKVVARLTSTGTHQSEYMGIPATGKRWRIGGITISRIAGGKFVESWGQDDVLGFLQQLGAIPALGQIPA